MKQLVWYLSKGIIASVIFLSLTRNAPAIASGDFRADYDVHYAVAPTGNTIVTQTVSLTNQRTNLYAKRYDILIDSIHIANVVAYDAKGILTPAIDQKDGKTNIRLTFNDRAVGLGRVLKFTLRFEDTDIAQKNGKVWEIYIPGIKDDPDIGSYTVTLDTPSNFGPNAYLVPLPAQGRTWTREQMVGGGISGAFGTTQSFHLTIAYDIVNRNVTEGTQDIALPPDTAYQTVTVQDLHPRPISVTRDRDGNWLARYRLSPNQQMEVVGTFWIVTTIAPQATAPQEGADPTIYLKNDRYWESTDPTIVSLAQRYRTAQDIYNFVVSTLKYDYNRVNARPIRKGALAALKNPKESICTEFTDLFIAIARAAGIAARENVGFAYTTNATLRPLSLVTDILHAWPEYYDKEQHLWVPIDPTWANTTGGVNYFDKLDFNHIVFAIHGGSSEYPYPAGFYRDGNRQGKTIKIRFDDSTKMLPAEQFSVDVSFPKTVFSGLGGQGTVTVHNTSGRRIEKALISVSSTPVDVNVNQERYDIPPLGAITIPLSIPVANYFFYGKGSITASANGTIGQLTFTIQPMYWLLIPIGILLSAIIVLAWLVMNKPKLWNFKK